MSYDGDDVRRLPAARPNLAAKMRPSVVEQSLSPANTNTNNTPSRGAMPLTPAYEWAETAGGVSVRVRWTGVGRQGVDVLAADCYVKVGGPRPRPLEGGGGPRPRQPWP